MYVPSEIESAAPARDRIPAAEPTGGNAREALAALIRSELRRPTPAAVEPLVAEIRRRHGNAVASIVLYGSCLRTGRYDDGILDFYVGVDAYRDAYGSRLARLANVILPPNVYFLELRRAEGTLRAKYAVLSDADFFAGTSLAYFQSVVWARFSQPALLVYVRDPEAAANMVRIATESTLTMVLLSAALAPDDGTSIRIRPDDLWRLGLAQTYGAELRVESADTVRGLYAAAPARYDRVTRLAVAALVEDGILRGVSEHNDELELVMDPALRQAVRRRWDWRRRTGKPLAAARLLKAFATFGHDGIPYGLAKLERHTGIRIEVTERQRRWGWITCWPTIARLLLRRTLR